MKWRGIMWGASLALAAAPAHATEVLLFDGRTVAGIVHDDRGAGRTLGLAADLLSRDLQSLSGQTPVVASDVTRCAAVCVVVGLYNAPQVARLARLGHADLSSLRGQWEIYRRLVVRNRARTYIVIAGSDRRGAVYGTVDLSRSLGVSPWEWWADVAPRHHDRLAIDEAEVTSTSPSVKYRGIFLNDEDWGLEPWAAKTFDPKTGNIGPKTYAKVFELMWRLKADTLWPAMHSVSTPFYGNPGNPPLADDYAIVIGTSHAEPMMRNNLREWDEAKRGAFDFTRNGPAILDYWRERVNEVKGYENIYTVGLRGIHDGPMQGASTMAQRQAVLQDVIGKQRNILGHAYNKPAADVPQLYVAYHELQEAYDAGLKVPDDVTLMWADDNYGYLRRLGTPDEQKRTGGAGIYYHISYWGRPHDYLWLATTHPALLREEMGRAWDFDARRIWIVNVGDIKPGEFLTQYFLDLAFDAERFKQSPREALTRFMTEQFGADQAPEIADIMLGYYNLAWARKPEFMGFGQTEWVTQNRHSDFVRGNGEEAQSRMEAYQALVARADAVAVRLPADRRDAFFELVLYPVRAASALNTRILKLDLADLYAEQGRASANLYAGEARTAQTVLVRDTETYNSLQSGKWRGMMDLAPRQLPVFQEPLWPHWSDSKTEGCDVALSGQWINDHNTLTFVADRPESRPVTLFGYQPRSAQWTLSGAVQGLALSAGSGALDAGDRYEQRLSLTYDGQAGPGDRDLKLTCDGREVTIHTRVLPSLPANVPVEDNRVVTLRAADAATGPDWQTIDGLGSLGRSLRARLDLAGRTPADLKTITPATFAFATSTEVGGTLRFVVLPTHALTPKSRVRILVQLDDETPQVLDFTTVGRSDEWRGDVLSNTAVRDITLPTLAAGRHALKIYALDPGVILDRIEVDLDGAPAHYGPERIGGGAAFNAPSTGGD